MGIFCIPWKSLTLIRVNIYIRKCAEWNLFKNFDFISLGSFGINYIDVIIFSQKTFYGINLLSVFWSQIEDVNEFLDDVLAELNIIIISSSEIYDEIFIHLYFFSDGLIILYLFHKYVDKVLGATKYEAFIDIKNQNISMTMEYELIYITLSEIKFWVQNFRSEFVPNFYTRTWFHRD